MPVKLLLSYLLALLCARSSQAVQQKPFQSAPNSAISGTVDLRLDSLRYNDYTMLSHTAHPAHSMRIKATNWCDPHVNVYTGYLDVLKQQPRHLFFYFFESRHDPATDDVVMWINGGPGCSSAEGLFGELGPCSLKNETGSAEKSELQINKYSWTTKANVFFLDQPVGVGFSYADYGETVSTTEEAAKDLDAFLSIFFHSFSSFGGRRLHLAGESYAGHYLPIFAATVYDSNRKLRTDSEKPPVNLASVIIGNGNTDPLLYETSRHAIDCEGAALGFPLLPVNICAAKKLLVPRCKRLMEKDCVDRFDAIGCLAAVDFCEENLGGPLRASGLNPYDVSKQCKGKTGTCFEDDDAIPKYLNQPEIRDLLGVDPGVRRNFSICDRAVGEQFYYALDKFKTQPKFFVSNLLDRGIPFLIFAGTYDWQCNWVGNEEWTRTLEWTGHEAFASKPLRPWNVTTGEETRTAGLTRSAGALTFATIFGAGHMVPRDKPVEALQMLNRWLEGEPL